MFKRAVPGRGTDLDWRRHDVAEGSHLVWIGTRRVEQPPEHVVGRRRLQVHRRRQDVAHMGLRDSKHINRIVIDPTDNNIVFVAATGPLLGSGGERGVYKTTDGGATWKQVLKGDDEPAPTISCMSPTDPQHHVRVDCISASDAVLHERRRAGQRHLEVDRWRRDVDASSRHASGRSAGPHRARRLRTARTRLRADRGRVGAGGRRRRAGRRRRPRRGRAPLAAAARAVRRRWSGWRRRRRWRPGGGASQTGLYRSDDGGTTWRRVNPGNPRPMYFSQVRIDPNSPDRVYLGGVGLHMTIDGGRDVGDRRGARRCTMTCTRSGSTRPTPITS